GFLVERVADGAVLGAGDGFFHEFVVYLFLDEGARAGAAALALIEEQSEVRTLDGLIHVGIGENNVGTLAAKFQTDALEVGFRRVLHDEVADFGRTGKRDLVDVVVARDRRPRGGTVARKQIYHTFGKSSFENQFAHTQGREWSLLGGFHHDGTASGEGGT